MEKSIKIFKNEKKVIIGRYSLFVGMFALSIIPPIADNYHSLKGLYNSILGVYQSYFEDLVSTIIFAFFLFFGYMFGAIISAKYVKTLEIKEKSLVIRMLGIIKNKILQIDYCDISKLEYSMDHFKYFVFFLKNGEKKVIKTYIFNKDEAFDLIQQKIVNSNKGRKLEDKLGS